MTKTLHVADVEKPTLVELDLWSSSLLDIINHLKARIRYLGKSSYEHGTYVHKVSYKRSNAMRSC